MSKKVQKYTLTALPPDLISRIFSLLPLSSFPSVAVVCRRFKVLLYNESIYSRKMEALGLNFAEIEGKDEEVDGLSSRLRQLPGGHLLPVGTKYLRTGSMWDATPFLDPKELEKAGSEDVEEEVEDKNPSPDKIFAGLPGVKKTAIIVGAGGLRVSSKKTKRIEVGKLGSAPITPSIPVNTSSKRDILIRIVSDLKEFYFDFRKRQKDSKLFREYTDIIELATILNRIRIFHAAAFYEDVQDLEFNLNTAYEWFEAFILGQFERGYDSTNVDEMRTAASALYRLNGGHACVQLFVAKNPMFYDSTFNPSLISSKLPSISGPPGDYTLANDFASFMDYTLTQCKTQIDLVAQIFPPEMDAMTSFVNRVFEECLSDYLNAVLRAAKERESVKYYLHTLASVVYCCSQFMDFLRKNGKVSVNIEGLKKNTVDILKPYTEKYLPVEIELMNKRISVVVEKWSKRVICFRVVRVL